MVKSEAQMFAVANRIREALWGLADHEADEFGEFDEAQFLTCLQLAAENVAWGSFDVRIGNASKELMRRFVDYYDPELVPRDSTPEAAPQPAA